MNGRVPGPPSRTARTCGCQSKGSEPRSALTVTASGKSACCGESGCEAYVGWGRGGSNRHDTRQPGRIHARPWLPAAVRPCAPHTPRHILSSAHACCSGASTGRKSQRARMSSDCFSRELTWAGKEGEHGGHASAVARWEGERKHVRGGVWEGRGAAVRTWWGSRRGRWEGAQHTL